MGHFGSIKGMVAKAGGTVRSVQGMLRGCAMAMLLLAYGAVAQAAALETIGQGKYTTIRATSSNTTSNSITLTTSLGSLSTDDGTTKATSVTVTQNDDVRFYATNTDGSNCSTGTATITATQSASSTYCAVTGSSVTATITVVAPSVTCANQTIQVAGSPAYVDLATKVGGTNSGSYTYSVQSGGSCIALDGSVVTAKAAGSAVVRITAAASALYAEVYKDVMITVNAAPSACADGTWVLNENSTLTFVAASSGSPTGNVSYSIVSPGSPGAGASITASAAIGADVVFHAPTSVSNPTVYQLAGAYSADATYCADALQFCVTVVPATCTEVTISGASTVDAGNTTTLTQNSGGSGTWSSDNKSVATVSSTGVVTGVAYGEATITFTPSDNTTYCTAEKTISVTNCEGPTVEVASTPGVVDVGDDAVMSVSATKHSASGTLSYQWYYDTDATPGGGTAVANGTPTGSTYSGGTSATLTATHTVAGTYFYYCVVTDNCNDDIATASEAITVSVTAGKICKAYVTDGSTTTLSGFALSTNVTPQTGTSGGKNKLGEPGKYIGITGTTFEEGDSIMLRVAKLSDQAGMWLSTVNNPSSASQILKSWTGYTSGGEKDTTLVYELTAADATTVNTSGGVYVGRTSTYVQNPYVTSMTVKRCCVPVTATDLSDRVVACNTTTTLTAVAPGATNFKWYMDGTKVQDGSSASYTTSAITSEHEFYYEASSGSLCKDNSATFTVAPISGALKVEVTDASSNVLAEMVDEGNLTVSLGEVEVGYGSAVTRTVTVYNTAGSGSTMNLQTTGFTSSSASITRGAWSGGGCGAIVGGTNRTATLTVATGLAAGTYSGTMTFADLDALSPCHQNATLNWTFTVKAKTPSIALVADACESYEVSNAGADSVRICQGKTVINNTTQSVENITALGCGSDGTITKVDKKISIVGGKNFGYKSGKLIIGIEDDCVSNGADNRYDATEGVNGYITFKMVDVDSALFTLGGDVGRDVEFWLSDKNGSFISKLTTATGTAEQQTKLVRLQKFDTVYVNARATGTKWAQILSIQGRHYACTDATATRYKNVVDEDATGTANLPTSTTPYHVAVRSTASGWSNVLEMYSTPDAVTTVGDPVLLTSTSFRLNWTAAAGATFYKVRYKAEGGSWGEWVNVTGTTYTLEDLTGNTKYYYEIVSYAGTTGSPQCHAATKEANFTTPDMATLTIRVTDACQGTLSDVRSTVTYNEVDYVDSNGDGTIEVPVPKNTELSLDASLAGYTFVYWGQKERSEENPRTLTVTADSTLHVAFRAADAGACKTLDHGDWNGSKAKHSGVVWVDTLNVAGNNVSNQDGTAFKMNQNNAIGNLASYITYSCANGDVPNISSISFKAANAGQGSSYTQVSKLYVIAFSDASATEMLGDTITVRSVVCSSSYDDCSTDLPAGTRAIKITNYAGPSSADKYRVLVKDIEICTGVQDMTAPTAVLTPTAGTVDVPIAVGQVFTDTITSDYPLYKYNELTGAQTALANGDQTAVLTTGTNFSVYDVTHDADATSKFTLTTCNYNSTKDSLFVKLTSNTALDYNTVYRLTVHGITNCEGMAPEAQTTYFRTVAEPIPDVRVLNNAKVAFVDDPASYSMGSYFANSVTGTTGQRYFYIVNSGTSNSTLTLTSVVSSGTDAGRFVVGSAMKKDGSGAYAAATIAGCTLDYNDTLRVPVTFTTETPSALKFEYEATLTVTATQVGGHPSDNVKVINLNAVVGTFVLPYTYESGCVNPLISAAEVRHDYLTNGDVPDEISLPNNGKADPYTRTSTTTTAGLVPSYNVYNAEGNCGVNGNSALRVGQYVSDAKDNRLKIALDHSTNSHINGTIGTVEVHWSAPGVRRIKVYDSNNVIYLASGYRSARTCYEDKIVINNCTTADEIKATTLYIEFIGTEDDALATVNYLKITPCDPEYISSEANITDINGLCVENDIFKENGNIIILTADPDGDASCGSCSSGVYDATTFEPSEIIVSPNATVAPVTPAAGGGPLAATIDANGYFEYEVTAQDGVTKNIFYVSIQCPTVTDINVAKCYSDSITYTLKMHSQDQTLRILYASQANGEGSINCEIPVDAVSKNSHYTIHYLTTEDVPAWEGEGLERHPVYEIEGNTTICVGSTAKYRIANAPESNNPRFRWVVRNASGTPTTQRFTIVGGTDSIPDPADGYVYSVYTDSVMVLQAPEVIADDEVMVSISIQLSYRDLDCGMLNGSATKNISATLLAPTHIADVSAACKLANGDLQIAIVKPLAGDSAVGDPATYPVIDASMYKWSFYDLDNANAELPALSSTMDVNADGSVATIHLNNTAPNLNVMVTAENACGSTKSHVAALPGTPVLANYLMPLNYAAQHTMWKGTATGVNAGKWDERTNWTQQVPSACTDVTIPALDSTYTDEETGQRFTVRNYPVIESASSVDSIVFLPGGGVKGLENLTYNRAVVQQTFRREKWYTITAPLKQMYTGDYYYNGRPDAFLRYYDVTEHPDHGNGTLGTLEKAGALSFTSGVWGLNYALEKGKGYAYFVDKYSYVGSFRRSSSTADQTVTLPRTTAKGELIPSYQPYSMVTGKVYGTAQEVTRTGEQPYRFMYDANNSGAASFSSYDVTLKTGYNLIGNPVMTHMNFTAFKTAMGDKIENEMKIWNGETQTAASFVGGSTAASVLGAQSTSRTIVPPTQAFFVNHTGAGTTLSIDPTASYFFAPVSGTSNMHMRSDEEEEPNTLYIVANDGETETYASLRNQPLASDEFRYSEDADKLFSAHASSEVYTLTSGRRVDVNQFKSDAMDVPVGICNFNLKDGKTATTRLTFDGAESFADHSVSLVNKVNGDSIDLKVENTYDFTYDKTTSEGALYIVFRTTRPESGSNPENPLTAVEDAGGDGKTQIYVVNGNTIRVLSPTNDLIEDVDVYTSSGKRIVAVRDVHNHVKDITLNAGSRSVMVKVVTRQGTSEAKLLLR